MSFHADVGEPAWRRRLLLEIISGVRQLLWSALVVLVLAASGCAGRVTPSATSRDLDPHDVAQAPVIAYFQPSATAQAGAAVRACASSTGFHFRVGQFARNEVVLVTHQVPWYSAPARAIGACLSRQPGFVRLAGLMTMPVPAPCPAHSPNLPGRHSRRRPVTGEPICAALFDVNADEGRAVPSDL